MEYSQHIKDHDVFLFELDNVVFPEKDYQLQVYYLFAQFIEYGEQIDAQGIISFMSETYLKDGEALIFEKTASKFSLPEKYKVNFELLQQNARLPLKLLLYAPVLSLMQEVVKAGKKLFLLAEGDPLKQLNKIRQTEWNGVEKFLTVYFTQETGNGSMADALKEVTIKHELDPKKALFLGAAENNKNNALSCKINFLSISKLLVT